MAPPKRPWFRFYVEAIHDPKLRRLPPAQRWLWVVVLAMARSSPEPGTLYLALAEDPEPMTVDDLADAAGIKRQEAESGVRAFVKLGMMTADSERGVMSVSKWKDRQYESDKSTDRTAKHRSSNGDATAMQRPNDDDGTSPENREQIQRTDTQELVGNSRKSRAPAAFPVSDELRAWARDHQVSVDLDSETERFLDYHRAKKSLFADWTAAWRNWMRKATDFANERNGGTGGVRYV